MNKYIIAILAMLFLGPAVMVRAQSEIAMTGTVKDVYGNPIPGVVLSVGNKDIYITDKDGNFAFPQSMVAGRKARSCLAVSSRVS